MWPVLPGTSRQVTPGPAIQRPVSSADTGGTPAAGRTVPLEAPDAPLGLKTATQTAVGRFPSASR